MVVRSACEVVVESPRSGSDRRIDHGARGCRGGEPFGRLGGFGRRRDPFSYTGTVQGYSVPSDGSVCSLQVDVAAANGGNSALVPGATGSGGVGGQATATFAVDPGDVVAVIVGGVGAEPAAARPRARAASAAAQGGDSSGLGHGAAGGGGGTIVLINGDLALIAGGGGGLGLSAFGGDGGAGGGGAALTGSPGSTPPPGPPPEGAGDKAGPRSPEVTVARPAEVRR